MQATATSLTPAAIAGQVRQAFPFSVDQHRLYGPENLRTDHFGLFRSDTMACVGTAVSSRYEPHTTDDVVALAEAAGAAFDGAAAVRCYWSDGHYVTVAPTAEWRRSVLDGGADTIWPRLIIRAGYDGRAFRASLGMYRDLCRNLAELQSIGDQRHATIRHTASLRDRMDELVVQFRGVAGAWDRTVETAGRMQAATIDLGEYLTTLYPRGENDSARKTEANKRRAGSIIARIGRERLAMGRSQGDLTRATAWEAFNGVQGYVQHTARRRGNAGTWDRAIAALADPAVRRAESLALELAA